MSEHESARRGRRIAVRKAQILNAAAIVFAEKGFHRATTRDIADTAQIAEGTIYNYFANKHELLLALIDRITSLNWRQEIPDDDSDIDFKTFLVQQLTHRIKEIRTNLKMFQAVIPEILSTPELREAYNERFLQPVFIMLEGYLQKAIDRGQIRSVNIAFVTRAFTSMVGGFYLMGVIGDPVAQTALKSPEALAEEFADLIFEGLK